MTESAGYVQPSDAELAAHYAEMAALREAIWEEKLRDLPPGAFMQAWDE